MVSKCLNTLIQNGFVVVIFVSSASLGDGGINVAGPGGLFVMTNEKGAHFVDRCTSALDA